MCVFLTFRLWMSICLLTALTGCYTQLRPPSSFLRSSPDTSVSQDPIPSQQDMVSSRVWVIHSPRYQPYRALDCSFYDPYDGRWVNRVRARVLYDPFWFDTWGYGNQIVVIRPRWQYPGRIYQTPPVYIQAVPEVVPEISKRPRIRRVGFGAEEVGSSRGRVGSQTGTTESKAAVQEPKSSGEVKSKKQSDPAPPKPNQKKEEDKKEKRQEKRQKRRRRGGMS